MSDNEIIIKAEIEKYIDAGFIPEIDFYINCFGFEDPDNEQEVSGYDVIVTSVKNFLNPDYQENERIHSKYTQVGLQTLWVLNGILKQCYQPGDILGQAVFCSYEK